MNAALPSPAWSQAPLVEDEEIGDTATRYSPEPEAAESAAWMSAPLADEKGTPDESAIAKVLRRMEATPRGAALVGVGEAVLNLGTGMLAQIPAGYAALANPEDASRTVEEVGRRFTYKPRTETGRQFAEKAAVPFELLQEGVEAIGERVAKQHESIQPANLPSGMRADMAAPAAFTKAATETALNAAMMGLPLGIGRGKRMQGRPERSPTGEGAKTSPAEKAAEVMDNQAHDLEKVEELTRAYEESGARRSETRPPASEAEPTTARGAAVDQAAHEAATSPTNDLPEPTAAQRRAGNYAKGHLSLNGLDIAIENPRGSVRSGVDPDGQPWSVTMQSHYGYIKRTVGKDGDHVDVFLGPKAEDPALPVFVVDQLNRRRAPSTRSSCFWASRASKPPEPPIWPTTRKAGRVSATSVARRWMGSRPGSRKATPGNRSRRRQRRNRVHRAR